MADREKVIKKLQDALENAEDNGKIYAEIRRPIVFDAITLLKEQEAVKRTYRTEISGFSIIWTCGACGSDLHPNNAKAKYCSNCGQAVKWE